MIQRIPITSREQWLALRRQDVTASTVGALFGAHPYLTAGELQAMKSGVEIPGPDPKSAVIRRGNALEEVAAKETNLAFPRLKIEKAKHYFRDARLRAGATPDFFITDPDRPGVGVLQTKVVASSIFKNNWTSETPPFSVSLQTLTEMMLTDASFGMVAALVIGDFTYEVETYLIERHQGAEKRIRDAIAEFWRALDAGEAPKIDYERDAGLLALLYPKERNGSVVDLSSDNQVRELLEQREVLKAALKSEKSQLDKIETEIKAKIADNEIATVPGWKISFRQQHRESYVVNETSYRVLRVKREAEF